MLTVLTVPAFNDNYFWLIHDNQYAAVVDPGDSVPVLAALAAHKLSLVAILLTHHHADHTGGVTTLLEHAAVPVIGPMHEDIAGVTRRVVQGDNVTLPKLGLSLSVLDVPGHTRGHIAYIANEKPWLFCGDTLFAGGCGRLFEGTPEQMRTSLSKLAALPDDTLVYCAHEYTLKNLDFALEVEPDNAVLIDRLERERQTRAQGRPTIPSRIDLEKATNPFLRYRDAAIVDRLLADQRITTREPQAVFTALRAWKDVFPNSNT
ncbi:MAG: hydroxyacylglutathione hydrolase [Pseudomonadota bacterium]